MPRTSHSSDRGTLTPSLTQTRWFHELLACPGCGSDRLDALDGWFYCSRCGHDLPVHKGIVYALAPELQPWFEGTKRAKKALSSARRWLASTGSAAPCNDVGRVESSSSERDAAGRPELWRTTDIA